MGRFDDVPDWAALRARNVAWLHGLGTDPLRLLCERCRDQGMQFWVSLRMNDDHDSYPGHAWLHGGYRRKHRELLIVRKL